MDPRRVASNAIRDGNIVALQRIVQAHPEVLEDDFGPTLLRRYLYDSAINMDIIRILLTPTTAIQGAPLQHILSRQIREDAKLQELIHLFIATNPRVLTETDNVGMSPLAVALRYQPVHICRLLATPETVHQLGHPIFYIVRPPLSNRGPLTEEEVLAKVQLLLSMGVRLTAEDIVDVAVTQFNRTTMTLLNAIDPHVLLNRDLQDTIFAVGAEVYDLMLERLAPLQYLDGLLVLYDLMGDHSDFLRSIQALFPEGYDVYESGSFPPELIDRVLKPAIKAKIDAVIRRRNA